MPRQTVDVSHLLRAALDHFREAVAVTTAALPAADPVLLHANRAFAELTGYRPDELCQQPVSALEGFHVGRSVLPRVKAALAAGQVFRQRVAQRQRNGRPYVAECEVLPLGNGFGAQHWLWRVRETGGTSAETPEQRLFAHGPVVIFRWHARDRWPVEYVSPNVAEVCGYTAVDFMSGRLSYADIVYPEDWPRVAANGSTDGDDEVSYRQQEYRIIHAFGGVRWLHAFTSARRDPQGRVTHYEGYVLDVTDRHNSEAALHAGDERFRAVFNSAEDSIFIKDTTRRYVQVNPAMARLFGRPAAELVGRTDADLFGPAATAHIDAVDRRVLAGETVEEEHTKPVAGSTYTFHVIKVPMRDAHGTVCGLCGIARDVTQHKTAEALLRASHAALEQRVAEHTAELRAANEELRREIDERRLVEDELRDSQRLVQQINDTTPSLIYLYDQPTQHMVYANDYAGRFFGFDPGRAIEITMPAIAQRVHPDDRAPPAQLAARLRTLAEGRVLEGEYRFRADDGTWRWLRRREIVFTRTEDGEPELVLGTALDVTELKRIEELLRVQRDLSHALGAADSLPQAFDRLLAITARIDGVDVGGVYLVDEATGDLVLAAHRGLSTDFVSQVARVPADAPRAQLVSQGIPLYFRAGDLADLAVPLAADGIRSVAAIPVRHGGRMVASLHFGSHDYVELPEAVRHALEVIASRLGGVIERVRATAALRESHDLLQAVIDGTQDIVYVKDLAGCYRMANAAAAALIGQALAEALGKTDADLLSPADAEVQAREDRRVIETNAPVTFEHTATFNGRTRHFLTFKAPQHDAAGRLVGIIGVSRDITDFKAAQEQLQRAARLASIGTFAAGIAHEINNPVGGILLAAEAAFTDAGELQDTAFVRKCLTEIAEDARRCGRIVQSVLRFARRQPTERWPCDLNELVQRARNLTRAAAAQFGGEVALRLDGGLRSININPTEIEQALINLIQNALEAGGGGTRVEVTTQALPGLVRIAVADNGPGVAPHQRAHIFDPFFTTRLESGGTGLGLSVVHGIVRAHGGTIDVGAVPHGGTIFTIDLPCPEDGGGNRVSDPGR